MLNASLWDVMSTGLSQYPEHLVEARAAALRTAFYPLMSDEEFVRAITYGPNGVKRVRYRFEATERMFREVVDAEST